MFLDRIASWRVTRLAAVTSGVSGTRRGEVGKNLVTTGFSLLIPARHQVLKSSATWGLFVKDPCCGITVAVVPLLSTGKSPRTSTSPEKSCDSGSCSSSEGTSGGSLQFENSHDTHRQVRDVRHRSHP